MAPAAVLLCLHDHAADAPPGNAPALLPSIARARQFTIDRDDAENREANGLGSFRSVAFT
jgi:dihydrodipicolinate reductase